MWTEKGPKTELWGNFKIKKKKKTSPDMRRNEQGLRKNRV